MSPSSPHPYVLDEARLDALAASGLLSEDIDPALERWTRLSSTLLGAPIALISMIDRDRQFFTSQVGLPEEVAVARQTPLTHSFCQHVVATQEPLIITDAPNHPLVHDNPVIEEAGVLAYAGQPITSDGHTIGTLCVMDHAPREWSAAELGLLEDLAAGLTAEIHLRAALRSATALQTQLEAHASTDALTGLANRRQLGVDLGRAVAGDGPPVLAMFDLDGFKAYNDTFGHPAGDALLMRLAGNLAAVAAAAGGTAYRLGGDEFCVLVGGHEAVALAVVALREQGDGFLIGASHGAVRLDDAPLTVEQAMLIADEGLYRDKRTRSEPGRKQAHDVLMSVLRESEPGLEAHVRTVAVLARLVGDRLGLDPAALDEVVLAAQLHDIGKVAIPDSILGKAGALSEQEWQIMRQHTLLGERILSAAPALDAVARIVRSSHERWDGGGYPDGLAATEIPLGSRIVLACDAFHAMASWRPYSDRRTVEEAVAELQAHAGAQFDAVVVAALIDTLTAERQVVEEVTAAAA